MFKNALVSVSDKTGLVEFLKPLAEKGLRIVSTGGTARHLREHGMTVIDVSEQTGYPEVMDGRVKTLHPRVHMALLARASSAEDAMLLKKENLEIFDLVIGNLYPFAEAAQKFNAGKVDFAELIENIDIGGPSFLRSAAKNFERVAIICDPADYKWVQDRGELSIDDRKRLAGKVFAHTSCYDSMVAGQLGINWQGEFSIGGKSVIDLRYGENPHQAAAWFRLPQDNAGMHKAQIVQGKPLSYNNILDLDAAANLVQVLNQHFSTPAVVAVKHNNPCGVAIDKTLFGAATKALAADPTSVFGGILAINVAIDEKSAELMSSIFLECIVAPDFSPQALEIFSKKKNLRILKWSEINQKPFGPEMRTVRGGFILQNRDDKFAETSEWKYLSEQPSAATLSDLKLAEIIGASLKSNSICLVKNGQTIGLGMGQVNRVEAVQHAVDRMHHHHGKIEGVIMASDAFFPFADSIETAAKNGIQWIVQPGGSMRDEEVFAAAKKLGINMVLSGTRHFRH